MNKLTTEILIERFKVVHGDLYDYSKTRHLINETVKAIIICKIHGSFKQSRYCHLSGQGCPECGKIKQKQTLFDRYGVKHNFHIPEVREQMKKTNLERYGYENPNQSPKIQKKSQQTLLKKYGVKHNSQIPELIETRITKMLQTKINNGKCIDPSYKDPWIRYQELVRTITEKSFQKYYYQINPNNYKRSRTDYHLDHIYSQINGFINSVSHEIIGHWTNLQLIDEAGRNMSKHTTNEKTLLKLYEDYRITEDL